MQIITRLDNDVTGNKLLSFIDVYSNVFEIIHAPIYTIDEVRSCEFEFHGEHLLKILNNNVRGFHENLDKIVSVLDSMGYKPNVIILSETWLQPISHDFAQGEGYIATHCLRSINNSGDFSLFINKNLITTKLDFMTWCDTYI